MNMINNKHMLTQLYKNTQLFDNKTQVAIYFRIQFST